MRRSIVTMPPRAAMRLAKLPRPVEPQGPAVEEELELPARVLRAGREEIRAVLVPYLGATVASERASNLAQALSFGGLDPASVATLLLGHVSVPYLDEVARKVCRAWIIGIRDN